MHLKFSLTPQDYLSVLRDYYRHTEAGRKSRRAMRVKMILPILALAALFYALRGDLVSTLALILFGVLILLLPPTLMMRRYGKKPMLERYGDTFAETHYDLGDRGVSIRNREKKTFVEWSEVVLARKTGTGFWLRTRQKTFIVFPMGAFDSEAEFEKAYAFAAERAARA